MFVFFVRVVLLVSLLLAVGGCHGTWDVQVEVQSKGDVRVAPV